MTSKEQRLTMQQPVDVIPFGAGCGLSGSFELTLTVPHDESRTVTLSFDGVPLTCASSPFDQSRDPNELRLMLKVWDDDEDSPSRRLLDLLEQINLQQSRHAQIYGDGVFVDNFQVADLARTPLLSIGESFADQKDFQTKRPYTVIDFAARRSAVTVQK